MTLFEKNMEVEDLYDPVGELDMTSLTPDDVESERTLNNGKAEFWLTTAGTDKIERRVEINQPTQKFLRPYVILFSSDGIIRVTSTIHRHNPPLAPQYIGGMRTNSETTNIMIPKWMKYRASRVLRKAGAGQ